MYKKGQGISINVIIIAAIALVVLVILSVIFMGRMGIFTRESSGTEYCLNTLGGDCRTGLDINDNPVDCRDGKTKVGTCDDGSYCCKSV